MRYNYTTTEDQTLLITAPGILGNDNDGGDGGPLGVDSIITQPSHGTVTLNPDGSFTYTPNANFSGTDSFTYKNSDGQTTSTATVTINVTCVNDPPEANNDTYTTNEDTPVVMNILANGSDPDGDPFTVTSGSGTSNGTLTRTAIKLRKISPLLTKEGLGVVEKIYFIQVVNYHPLTPSLVRRGRTMLNLMAVTLSSAR